MRTEKMYVCSGCYLDESPCRVITFDEPHCCLHGGGDEKFKVVEGVRLLKNNNELKHDEDVVFKIFEELKERGLTKEKAFEIIWMLQEVVPLLPNYYEMCSECECIYNLSEGGEYVEDTQKFYCESCRPPYVEEADE